MSALIAKLIPLLVIIESHGNPNAVGDNGKGIGILQIHRDCWADGTGELGVNWPYKDAKDPEKAREVCRAYLIRFGRHYEKQTGKSVDMETLARIWNGGPRGYQKEATKKYWAKVSQIAN